MKSVVVIFSGGIDSSLCLFEEIAKRGKDEILAVSFDYGQTHRSELNSAKKIAQDWAIDHIILPIDIMKEIANSSLLNRDLDMNGVAKTGRLNVVLPGRNGLFIRIASMLAFKYGAYEVVTGINYTDAPNFADCKRSYMDALEKVLQLDFDKPEFKISTPIAGLEKKAIFERAEKLGILDYLLENTISCYNGIPKDGCQNCPACHLKSKTLSLMKTEK